MTHLDAAQTATLHAIPAFAAWARARGFRVGDKALDADGRDFLVVQVYDDKFTGIWGIHMCDDLKAADCRLMASESDLMDYLDAVMLTICRSDTLGYTAYTPMYGGEGWYDTRLGALVAAVEAVEGGTDR